MNICRFDPSTAKPSHEGTILADDVLPRGMQAPFSHAYGCLERGQSMMGHAHATDEVYLVLSGTGVVIIDGKNRAVRAGDAIAIPPNAWHTMICTEQDSAPFLWAAFWWPHLEGGEPFTGEIALQRFDLSRASSENGDPKLSDYIVPPQLKVPFGHAYGYLKGGDSMIPHRHHENEIYGVISGTAVMTIGNESALISDGDVVGIPVDVLHTITAQSDEFLWYALWWEADGK